MNPIEEEEDSLLSSSSYEETSAARTSHFDPRETRVYGPRSVAPDDALERAFRFTTFVSAYEEPIGSESPRSTFLGDGSFSRSGGRRHSQANRDEETQQPSRKSTAKGSYDDSVMPPSDTVDILQLERRPERQPDRSKNSSVEMFPLLVRGLDTSKSGDVQYRRSDSAFDTRTLTETAKREKEDEVDKDDGKTGGTLMYKAKVDYLHKLVIGNPKPQDVLFKLLQVKPNSEGPETGITGLVEYRNTMKDKELLAAASRELAELNAAYLAATQESYLSHRKELEEKTTTVNSEIDHAVKKIKQETETIVTRNFGIKDAHRRHAILLADINTRFADNSELRLELESHLESEKESAEITKRVLDEAWERADMRKSELETLLAEINSRKEHVKARAEKSAAGIEAIRKERERQLELEDRMHSSLQLLQDTLQYVKEFADREDFIVSFRQEEYVEELKVLQQECFEAAQAEQKFEEQARTDPRKLLPYSRSTVTSNIAKF